MKTALFAGAALLVAVSTASADVQLTMKDGRVSLRAKDATPGAGDAAKTGVGTSAGASSANGVPGNDGPRGLLSRSPKGWGLLALIAVGLAALGGLIVPLVLKRRRSVEDGSLPR